jgi:GWxTD domain-containing protein
LLESCLARAPVAIGHLKPAIVVPIGLLTGLRSDRVEAILLHELAHIRRADYLLNLLQAVMEGLLFYHPAAWWISGVIRAEREHCCDDIVIAAGADAREYALALAAVATDDWITVEGATAATGGNLVQRVHRLLDPTRRPRRIVDPLTFAGVLITAGAALVAWPASLHPEIALALSPPAVPLVTSIQPSARATGSKLTPRRKRTTASFAVTQTSAADRVFSPFVRKPALSADPFEKWLDELCYIISPEERASFEKLRTDRERNEFINRFWSWRPEGLKTEHYRRIAYANERFGTSLIPGWKTDRGLIYIKYGPPDEIETHPRGGPDQPASEHWLYRNALHITAFAQRSVDKVVIDFIESSGNGDYHIVTEPERFMSLPNSSYGRPRNVPASNRAFFSPGSGSPAVVEIAADGRRLLTIPLEFPARQHTIAATTVSADGKTSYEKLETEVPCGDSRDTSCRGFYHATASAELPPGSYVFSALVQSGDKSLQKTYVVNFSVRNEGGSLLP